jgi:hypothetical protein
MTQQAMTPLMVSGEQLVYQGQQEEPWSMPSSIRSRITSAELDQMHGMGKSSIARIKVIMHGKKIQFRL